MKRTLCGLALLLCLGGPSWAQNATTPAPKVQTIFDYKTELDLTDKQVESLKADVKALADGMADGRKKITQLEGEYQTLIATNPPVDKVRAKLMAIAKEQAELKLLDYLTSRKITATLKPMQLNKWREIQDKVRKSGK